MHNYNYIKLSTWCGVRPSAWVHEAIYIAIDLARQQAGGLARRGVGVGGVRRPVEAERGAMDHGPIMDGRCQSEDAL